MSQGSLDAERSTTTGFVAFKLTRMPPSMRGFGPFAVCAHRPPRPSCWPFWTRKRPATLSFQELRTRAVFYLQLRPSAGTYAATAHEGTVLPGSNTACRELGDQPLANLLKFLTGKGWPDDAAFIPKFERMNLYSSKYDREVLLSLERSIQASSEPVSLDKCWIEHVMPQTIVELGRGRRQVGRRSRCRIEWRRVKGEMGSDARQPDARWLRLQHPDAEQAVRGEAAGACGEQGVHEPPLCQRGPQGVE